MTKKKLLSSLTQLQTDGIITPEAAQEAQKRLTAEKRHTGKIFTVVGAVIAAAGIIITFAALWDKIPALFIRLLSFLPLIGGAALGAFALTKEKANPILNESASVIWCAGAAAVLAGACSTVGGGINIRFNAEFIIAIFALLTLPVAFVLKSIVPLIAANAAAMFAFTEYHPFEVSTDLFICITSFAAFASTVIFAVLQRNDHTYRGFASRWLALAAAVMHSIVFINFIEMKIDFDLHPGVLLTPALAALLLVSLKRTEAAEPFKILGTVGAVTAAFITALAPCFYEDTTLIADFGAPDRLPLIAAACVSALTTVCFGVIYALKNKEGVLNSAPAIAITVSAVLLTLDTVLVPLPFLCDVTDMLYTVAGSVLTAALCICLIITGLKELKFAKTNLGIIGAIALIVIWVTESILSPIFIGLSLIVFGAGIIAANIRIAKQKKIKKALETIIMTDEGSESK